MLIAGGGGGGGGGGCLGVFQGAFPLAAELVRPSGPHVFCFVMLSFLVDLGHMDDLPILFKVPLIGPDSCKIHNGNTQ